MTNEVSHRRPAPDVGHDQLEQVVVLQQALATSDHAPDGLMGLIAEQAAALVDADGATVEIIDGDDLVYRAATGSLAPHVGLRVPRQGSLSGLCVETGTPLRADDTETDPRVDRDACRRTGIRSFVVVPLHDEELLTGVLKVAAARPAHFDEGAESILGLVGALLGAALGRAQALAREQELVAQLRTADEFRTALVSATSHDLRGRIAAILGFAELLISQDATLTAEARREYVGEIVASARRTRRLLSDLLDLDRVTRGRVEVRRQPTDLGALAATVAAEVGGIFHRHIDADAEPVSAEVDPVLVERMLENLATNAAKFAPSGAHIRIRAEATNGDVVLAVEDAGPGVPEADREAIFERFRRGSEASKTAPGSGIGLYLVRSFAELHGGQAWVEDGPEGGASFRIRLPTRPHSASRTSTEGQPTT